MDWCLSFILSLSFIAFPITVVKKTLVEIFYRFIFICMSVHSFISVFICLPFTFNLKFVPYIEGESLH